MPVQLVYAAGLFDSLCSIYKPTQVTDASGQVDLTDLTPRAGLQNLPCMVAVLVDAKPTPNYENKQVLDIESRTVYHVLLGGYYPSINFRDIAIIDGINYDVINVESDSQHTQTRLAIRLWVL